jgi:hypothetical protein
MTYPSCHKRNQLDSALLPMLMKIGFQTFCSQDGSPYYARYQFQAILLAVTEKMILRIYRDANLNKRLAALRRAGGQAAIAADHAEAIIDRLITRGIRGLGQTGRFTRYGDARIKNCIKYDLVQGYRLVGVKKEDELIFLYVGSHDDCDLWIRHNIGIEPMMDKRRSQVLPVQGPVPEVSSAPRIPEPEPDYDEELLKGIDDKDLRKIFRGLCGQ